MLKRFLAIIAAAAITISFAGCNSANILGLGIGKKILPAAELDENIVKGNTEFGIDIFKILHGGKPEKNLFISPASISLALAMTLNGANNDTYQAMLDALRLEGMEIGDINFQFNQLKTILENPDPKVELTIANSIWAREGLPFKKDFLVVNKEYYDARVEELDFDSDKASETINKWVKDKTKNKIDKMIEPPIDPQIIMILMNAIYFNGTWQKEFDENWTSEQPFDLLDGSKKQVQMMRAKDKFEYFAGDGFESILLPYGEGRVGMYVFLPDRDSSLEEFIDGLDSERWDSWMGSYRKLEGTVKLPKFKFEYEANLNEALKTMGMEIAFDAQKADFGKMIPTEMQNVYIGNVKHKSYIDVNEKGTEAAAVTSVEMEATGYNPNSLNMVVDRPFMFSIVDNLTGTILFMGAVTEP